MHSKNEYLNDKYVAGFVNYFAELIGGKRVFDHKYSIAKGGKNVAWIKFNSGYEWKCNSLESAFEQYFWENNGFDHNNVTLNSLAESLKKAIADNDEVKILAVCLGILEWGGVTNGAYGIAKLYTNGVLSKSLTNALAALTPDPEQSLNLHGFKDGSFIMNASFTKIYSLLSKQPFVIYDSRVAAALSLMIKKYWLDIREGNNEIPDTLKIACLDGRASDASRCASDKDLNIKFKMSHNDVTHALWNVRSNWLIEAALIKTGISNNEIISNMRKLEAALFMIGYDVA